MATGNTKYGDGALENNTTDTSPAGANNNSAFGIGALQNSSNYWNTAVGAYSGNSTTTGISNSSLGVNALLKNTTGSYNTALGTASLCNNVDGNSNTAIGSNAMAEPNNITGSENTALGTQAGYTNSGNQNTFLGAQTDASGIYSKSTAIGYGSLITGSNQIKMGTTEEVVIPGSGVLTNTDPNSYSLATSIVPKSYVDSIASGLKPTSACKCATTVSITLSGNQTIDGFATANGDRVLVKNQGALLTENTNNIDNGIYVADSGIWSRASDCDTGDDVVGQLTYIESGDTNNFKAFSQISNPAIVGTYDLQYAIFYSTSFSLGNGLELSGSTLNVKDSLTGFLDFVGINGGTNTAYSIDTGTKDALIHGISVGLGGSSVVYNTAVGTDSLKLNTSGQYNTAVGYKSLTTNTTGQYNTAIGLNSLQSNTSGQYNTALGVNSLSANITGQYNTAIGTNSLQNNTNINNTAIGASSLQNNTTGRYNTAIGTNSLQNNTTGDSNIAIGHDALKTYTKGDAVAIGTLSLSANTTGLYNTAIGHQSLTLNTSGQYNTALGYQSLLGNTIGQYNTVLGYSAGSTITTGSNNICIGNNAQPSSATSTSQIVIGTSAETMYVQGGFNMRVGPDITSSPTTLATQLCQFYVVTTGAVTIILPLPGPLYKGAQVNFTRHGLVNTYTFQTSDISATPYFWNLNSTAGNNTLITGSISNIMLWCDGTYWNSQFYSQY